MKEEMRKFVKEMKEYAVAREMKQVGGEELEENNVQSRKEEVGQFGREETVNLIDLQGMCEKLMISIHNSLVKLQTQSCP